MTISAAAVKAATTARFSEDISTLIDTAFAAAIAFYSRYNPVYIEAELELLEDIRVYDQPSGFLLVDYFDWWPSGEATVTMTTDELWNTVYKQSLQELKASRLSPYVRFESGKIILAVKPTDDETVEYAYYSMHQASGDTYATIPTEDFGIVVDLTTAEIISVKGSSTALDPDFTEGLLSIRTRNIPSNMLVAVDSLRAGVKAKYGGY